MIAYSGSELNIKDARKVFMKLGACSSALYFLLERGFDRERDTDARAVEPLAGGILRKGYQCGMLWGSAMSAGAESYRRYGNTDEAIGYAIHATQKITNHFITRMESVDCIDITGTDWNNKLSSLKFMLTGKMFHCFSMVKSWPPDAFQAILDTLPDKDSEPEKPFATPCMSCASEVARRMGASDEEIVTVAGFAGGIGLSGNACGALGAALWIKTLAYCRNNGKNTLQNPEMEATVEAFLKASDYNFLCRDITGKEFKSVEDHTDYIQEGGCEIIEDLILSNAPD